MQMRVPAVRFIRKKSRYSSRDLVFFEISAWTWTFQTWPLDGRFDMSSANRIEDVSIDSDVGFPEQPTETSISI
jgi:hypothetical protein